MTKTTSWNFLVRNLDLLGKDRQEFVVVKREDGIFLQGGALTRVSEKRAAVFLEEALDRRKG